MKTIPAAQYKSNLEIITQINQTLENKDIVCIPTPSGYKLLADLNSPDAVSSMLLAKRRTKNAPSLVFVPDKSWILKVANQISKEAHKLMNTFWPGEVTLLFSANDNLHPKVKRAITKAKGWIGVRIPSHDLSLDVVKSFGRPLLVSSANLAQKKGAHSLAQVKKNFGRTISLLLKDGDIQPSAGSTLVDVRTDKIKVIRHGAVKEEDILSIL
jgi:L-threonylcarbamoyladenylate synthase